MREGKAKAQQRGFLDQNDKARLGTRKPISYNGGRRKNSADTKKKLRIRLRRKEVRIPALVYYGQRGKGKKLSKEENLGKRESGTVKTLGEKRWWGKTVLMGEKEK